MATNFSNNLTAEQRRQMLTAVSKEALVDFTCSLWVYAEHLAEMNEDLLNKTVAGIYKMNSIIESLEEEVTK